MSDTYVGTVAASEQIASLMRRINALEASVGGTLTLDRSWGTDGTGNNNYKNPRFMYVLSGEVYVADTGNNRIKVTDTNGVYARQWVSNDCNGIFISGGEVYVSLDDTTESVTVYNTSGSIIRSWTADIPSSPRGLCVMSGNVYLTSNSLISDPITIFTTAGVLVSVLPSGTGNGEFDGPSGIWPYNNELYVADTGNARIQVIDSSGTYIRKWSVPFPFNSVVVDSGRVFARSNSLIYEYDTVGNLIQTASLVDGSPLGNFFYGGEFYATTASNDDVSVFSAGTAQTEFYSYTTTVKTALGTPDGGIAIPSLNALYANGAGPVSRHIIDMRDAIEAIAPNFTNAVTSNPFNWTASSADNLFFVANGDRTEYGATGGAAYDWTRTEAQMEGTPGYSLDIGEVLNCITLLEAS